ncbi:MAG: ribonuclease J [Clostridia bacterium]|nr:ribonuclease J [Clostridia bacterium]
MDKDKKSKSKAAAAPKTPKKAKAAKGKPSQKSVAKNAKGKPPIEKNKKRSAPRPPQKADKKAKQQKNNKPTRVLPIRIVPLGGLDEIGKNITLYEYGDDMFLVDCGMSFPDEETPGIDIVIPDFSYVIKNKDKIKGLVLTHGHEDHIGAIPYLLKNFNVPIYGTRLTLGLVEGKLKEHNLSATAKLCTVKPGDIIRLGAFSVEFIHVNHSIPDAVAVAIRTPAGTVVQTGDFKIDTTPIDGEVIDLARFAALGEEGVLALLADSTNAERAGYTASESIVGETFSNLFKKAGKHRIIVATFSSNIHRIQQIIDEAVRCDRKVAVSGRSMLNVVSIAEELGYLRVADGVLIDVETINKYPPEKLVIITTGSQGEPLSALHRISIGEHKNVQVSPNDMIIISANPIPGNEKLVSKVINQLLKRGANVVYEKMYDVHVSGHACKEELRLLMSIVKPRYFIPVHGEQKHLIKHAEIATAVGIPDDNIIIATNGNVIEINGGGAKITETVTAGRMLVDGLGVGDVGSIVLRDRLHLAEDGIIVITLTMDSVTGEVVAGPEVVSRGFVYVKESEEIMGRVNMLAEDILERCYVNRIHDWNGIKLKLRDGVSKFIYERTHRSPMILPIIMEI